MAETKNVSGSVFEQLRDELFREAAQLAADAPSSAIAITITPPPGYDGDISACSFIYPSAEGNVEVKAPEKGDDDEEVKVKPRGWWNKNGKKLDSMNLDELKVAQGQLNNLQNIVKASKMKAAKSAQGSSGNPKP